MNFKVVDRLSQRSNQTEKGGCVVSRDLKKGALKLAQLFYNSRQLALHM